MGKGLAEKTELNLIGNAGPVSKINTTLELQRIDHYWWTKDSRVTYQKRKEGWVALAYSDPICKAFNEYGITSNNNYEPTHFPSFKAVRQAVSEVSLEAGLDIDSKLTRQKYAAYKIGDLPLIIMKEEGHWRVHLISAILAQSLQKHFNSAEEFNAAWSTTGLVMSHYLARKAAHQAVINWLSQTITVGK